MFARSLFENTDVSTTGTHRVASADSSDRTDIYSEYSEEVKSAYWKSVVVSSHVSNDSHILPCSLRVAVYVRGCLHDVVFTYFNLLLSQVSFRPSSSALIWHG